MASPSTSRRSGFSWTRLPHNRGYELKHNSQVIGTVQHSPHWASDFVAASASSEWTFRRAGFLGVGATILDAHSQETIATFKAVWPNRGTLVFSDHQKFDLHCKGLWDPLWTIRGQAGEIIVSLHGREETISFGDLRSIKEERLVLMIMFALYRLQQAEEYAASTAMVA
jgi:hypothetical protein